jgi:dinuclear metal center YbgI/SA1388 family protein
MPTVNLQDIVTRLDKTLRLNQIKDYPNAVNGLQLQNREDSVSRVVVAVDACEAVIQAAAERGANLLIVHHGLFWGGLQPITGPMHRKLRLAMDNNLAVYSAHLPLDAHPELGNNILLAQALGLTNPQPVLKLLDDTPLGFRGQISDSRVNFFKIIEKAVGAPAHLAPGGPSEIQEVVVMTGGSGGEIAEIAAMGADTFVAGEGPHWSYTLAEELGVNLFYAGHYATETFGVKALGRLLEQEFHLPWDFIDHPTGL